MGASVIAQVRDARKQMLQSIRVLQKIGAQGIQQRLKISEKLPRSVDLEAGEAAAVASSGKSSQPKKPSRQRIKVRRQKTIVKTYSKVKTRAHKSVLA
jgi:hypothetical protein